MCGFALLALTLCSLFGFWCLCDSTAAMSACDSATGKTCAPVLALIHFAYKQRGVSLAFGQLTILTHYIHVRCAPMLPSPLQLLTFTAFISRNFQISLQFCSFQDQILMPDFASRTKQPMELLQPCFFCEFCSILRRKPIGYHQHHQKNSVIISISVVSFH